MDNNIDNNMENNQPKEPGTLSKLGKGILDAAKLAKGAKSSSGVDNMSKNQPNKPQNQGLKSNQQSGQKSTGSGNMPDSVKQKRDSLKNKQQGMNKGQNAAQQTGDQIKAKINEEVFKKGVRTAVDVAAPGTGEIAEKLLDTPIGQPAVEEARAASNPVSALKKGTKKLVEVVVVQELKKKILVTVISSVVPAILLIVILLSVISKFADSLNFFSGDLTGIDEFYAGGAASVGNVEDVSNKNSSTIISEDYKEFYTNIKQYANSNMPMVVAVLTSYKANDSYAFGDFDSDCTDEQLSTNTCDTTRRTFNEPLKMKRYIKKVDYAIRNSNYDVTEGDYSNPGNTGSNFFRWLFNDFIEDYYSEYLKGATGQDLAKRKVEILKYIYSFYDEIKSSVVSGNFINSSCPNGITVTGDGAGTYDLEDYVAGVIAHENYYYTGSNIEAMKAQAVAARTYALKKTANCTKPIVNSTTAQTFYTPEKVAASFSHAKRAAEETKGQVLTKNSELILSEYDGFYGTCNATTCTATYTKIPGSSKHTFNVPIKFIPSYARNYFGHGRGMSQYGSRWLQDEQGYTYEQILKYFYDSSVTVSTMTAATIGDLYAFGGSGIMGESVFPISKNDIDKVYKSAGWYYSEGDYHGAVDIACYAGNSSCHSIGIYSAHDGVVTKVTRDQCNCYSVRAANKTGLPYNSSCTSGTSITIKITEGPYKNYSFLYYHLSSVLDNYKVGDTVVKGQHLGYMGNTGKSSGPHLHFQLNDPSGVRMNFNASVDQLLSKIK